MIYSLGSLARSQTFAVMEAPTSAEALRLAGLDWKVVQEPVYTGYNEIHFHGTGTVMGV